MCVCAKRADASKERASHTKRGGLALVTFHQREKQKIWGKKPEKPLNTGEVSSFTARFWSHEVVGLVASSRFNPMRGLLAGTMHGSIVLVVTCTASLVTM
jgi:hypothetical protein